MAEPVLLDDCKVWLGGSDLSGSLNSIELTAAKAELGNKRFGDGIEVVYPGLAQITANMVGFFSAGATEPDAIVWPRVDAEVTSSGWPITFAPPAAPSALAGAEGNIAYTVVGKQYAYTLGGTHGELLPYNLTSKLESTYQLYRQMIISAKQLMTTTDTDGFTDTGASHEFATVGAEEDMVAVLHAFTHTGANVTCTVESDTASGFGSATTRFTFIAISGSPARQVMKLSGAIADTWWRAKFTTPDSGGVTAAVLLGIANQV